MASSSVSRRPSRTIGICFAVELAFPKFEHGVVLQLLFDAFFQGLERELEDLHALDHAGGEELSLLHPQVC